MPGSELAVAQSVPPAEQIGLAGLSVYEARDDGESHIGADLSLRLILALVSSTRLQRDYR
jgi:hypothetical protein